MYFFILVFNLLECNLGFFLGWGEVACSFPKCFLSCCQEVMVENIRGVRRVSKGMFLWKNILSGGRQGRMQIPKSTGSNASGPVMSVEGLFLKCSLEVFCWPPDCVWSWINNGLQNWESSAPGSEIKQLNDSQNWKMPLLWLMWMVELEGMG